MFFQISIFYFKKKKIAEGVRQKTERLAYGPVGRAFDIVANHGTTAVVVRLAGRRGAHSRLSQNDENGKINNYY